VNVDGIHNSSNGCYLLNRAQVGPRLHRSTESRPGEEGQPVPFVDGGAVLWAE